MFKGIFRHGADRSRFKDHSDRFAQREDGAIMVFSLILLVLMLMMGGVAVDAMRHESVRTSMQGSLDRAVLAAASLTQARDPETVVRDYIDKSVLTPNLTAVAVIEDASLRTVSASAVNQVETYFMRMMDQPTIPATATAEAEQRLTNVEISLVLDVSGSMEDTPSRIANLKAAAKEFVATILNNTDPDRVSISLVPYGGQVNLGPDVISEFNTIRRHGQPGVNCLDLPAGLFTAFSGTKISTTTGYPQAGFVDTFVATEDPVTGAPTNYDVPTYYDVQAPYQDAAGLYPSVACSPVPGDANVVTLLSNDQVALDAAIDALVPVGQTAMEVGMKWGGIFLDPTFRPVVAALAGNGGIAPIFADRPLDMGATNGMKVVVLMTDGANIASDQLVASYRDGNSPIYLSTGDGKYSVQQTSLPSPNYWVPHLGTWQSSPWNSGAGRVRLKWYDVWANLRMQWVAWQLFARPLGGDGAGDAGARAYVFNAAMNTFRTQISKATMNNRLQIMCNAAKAQGIVVYTVAFEAEMEGQAQLQSCASSMSHYFDAVGPELTSAFRSIAANIIQLRLTQ